MFGRVACSIFAMISGFFLIQKERVALSRIVMIVFDVLFFTALIAVIVWATGLIPMKLKYMIYMRLNWYVTYYVIFCFFVPYINLFLRALDRHAFAKLMLLIFIVWSVLPTLTFQQINFSDFDFFIVMYTAGAFIRLHVHGKMGYRNVWNLLIALGAGALMVLSVPLIDALAVKTDSDFLVQNACYFRDCNMVPAVICAVFLFLYFARLDFYSRGINFVAGSVPQIFIIHVDNYFGWTVNHIISSNYAHMNRPYLHALVKISCVFVFCLLISIVYRLTVRRAAERVIRNWKVPWGSHAREA